MNQSTAVALSHAENGMCDVTEKMETAGRRTITVRALGRGSAGLVAACTLLFLVAPLAGLCLWCSIPELVEATLSPMLWAALKISFVTSSISTLIVIVFGGVLAFILARYQFRGKMIVDTLVDLPMVLPPMVTGIALLILFGRNGPVGSWLAERDMALTFTAIAVVIAQVFVALPFFVRAARAGFEGVDRRLETASLLLGASKARTFFRVTVPLVWPTLLAGAILAWARCLGEFGATIVFAGNFQGVTQTMPLAIFDALQSNLGVAIALSLILLLVSFGLVLLLKFVVGGANVSRP
ncbi:MAG TPA: ABC transporter permease [Gallionella sp.]|nr:ABC transporter permease [Gallionella sp.]